MKRIFTILLAAVCCCVVAMGGTHKRTKKVPAKQPSEDIIRGNQVIHVYMDTIYTYTKTTSRTEQEGDTAFTRKGHYLQGLVGLGYSSMGHSLKSMYDEAAQHFEDFRDGEWLKKSHNTGGYNWLLQFNYAYYFHENWGVMTGLEFEHLNSYTVLNGTKTWEGLRDSDLGETYTHTVQMNNWRENEEIYMLGLPVGIQMQYPIARMPKVTHRNNQLRLYADLGAKFNYLLSNKYNLVSGSISHIGTYDPWGLEIGEEIGDDRDYYTETIAKEGQWSTEKNDLDLKRISIDGMADLGVMIPVAEHLDVMVGLYANYTFNNLRRDNRGIEIGWRNPVYANAGDLAYREHAFMNDYEGVLATGNVKAVRPWDIGVKVGISWHKPKKKHNKEVEKATSFELKRREVVDKIPVAAKKISDIMKTSVIWFDFDSDKPKLQPADVVDRIADVLLEHPEQKVLVYGHCSKEGSMEYNQRLSERRAASIVKLLKKKGVPDSQIVSKGFSYTIQYDDSENQNHDISLDRRVEIIPVFESEEDAQAMPTEPEKTKKK